MKRAFTLIEVIIVVVLFTMLFAAIIGIFLNSDRSWRMGQKKLFEQQEARRVMNRITVSLRQANPDWVINSTHYGLTISSSGKRLDFYIPVFDASGDITTLKKVTFKLNTPDYPRQLLQKVGLDDPVVISDDIENISFGGGCAACAAYTCSTLASDCPEVRVEVVTKKNAEFHLISLVTLRNRNAVVSEDVEIEQPEQGEF
jgi:prepilin-type N-terminal cleavage/methylation domain-containing protein